jgi:hypothetical protein
VRGAYAIAVDQPVTNAVTPLSSNPPLATPLTFANNIRLSSAAATATAAGLGPASITPDFNSGRMQTYNVNVERQIGPTLGVMVGYFGSQGDRLRISRNVNQLINNGTARPFPTLSASSPILPGAALTNIIEVTSLGESHYNGALDLGQPAPASRPAVQCVVHAFQVSRLQLSQFRNTGARLRRAE